ncbi:MAG: hypothetical protein JJ971_11735 [Balneolaceae bacterium]|nr:hypothetical protein [Balneolaceae bacterium]MBO6547479.1 hypothetical protein [Balneolaceae bacterium]MBO6647574.1 hypothetical protein [Balneolaceae bacterium]
MKRALFIFFLFSLPIAQAQIVGPSESPFFSIRQNGVSTIVANGDTVWTGPSLTMNIGNSLDWIAPSGLDSIDSGVGRAFSIAVNKDTVFAGLGFTSETLAGNQPAGYGYYISTDGAEAWRFIDFPLDDQPQEICDPNSSEYYNPNSLEDYNPVCDLQFTYGGETYTRVRITVPEQSPPYNVARKGNIMFSASWASGLLRSTDFGETWGRVILPPTNVDLLSPDQTYSWTSQFSFNGGSGVINRFDPRGDNNLLGFAVHIDSQNRVWFGSAGGINVSENALTAPLDSIIWRNYRTNGSSDGILGKWIIEIKEDTTTGKIWMTNWIADGLDRFGVVATNDGGQTFERHLIGEKILGIGFKDGFIFVAGENGLFISSDDGNSWRKSPQIKSPNTFIKETAEFQSVTATNDRVWIGTTDGIISSDDLGDTWEITRVNFPLSGGNQYDPEAKSVKAYAYPNPYSPTQHELVRIRFEVENPGEVTIRIFDFGMNLVRDLGSYSANSTGAHEAVWDGVDGKGRNVANGPYFYMIEGAGSSVNGKILLVD